MREGLEKILSYGKQTIAALAITAVTTLAPYSATASEDLAGARYHYFTQGENITTSGRHFPAQKGMIKKTEEGSIKQTGNCQTPARPPKTHQEVIVQITKKDNVLSLFMMNSPREKNLNRITPVYQQVYHEYGPSTHAYIILPKNVDITNERQRIGGFNERGEDTMLLAGHPDDTKLAKLMMAFNANEEGTRDTTNEEKTQLEQLFDNAIDKIPGKTGKITKATVNTAKWAIKRDEKKRIEGLEKKYGNDYWVYPVPQLIPEGINLTYSYVSRVTIMDLDTSNLENPSKIFIEIPKLTYEQNVPGATRMAGLEGLVYEMEIAPGKKKKIRTSSKNKGVVTMESVKYEGETFDFETGEIIAIRKGREVNYENLKDMDIFLDQAEGLVSNSKEISNELTGSGGIIDMGSIPMESVLIAPNSNYKTNIESSQLKIGHTYCVKTSEGTNYGKMEILEIGKGRGTPYRDGIMKVTRGDVIIKFKWDYQSKKNERRFDK